MGDLQSVRGHLYVAPLQDLERHWLTTHQSCRPSLLNATLDQLVEGLKNNHFTSVQLTKVSFLDYSNKQSVLLTHVQAYLTRIDQVNETVHAVVETNPDALAIAKALDDERASGTIRG